MVNNWEFPTTVHFWNQQENSCDMEHLIPTMLDILEYFLI